MKTWMWIALAVAVYWFWTRQAKNRERLVNKAEASGMLPS